MEKIIKRLALKWGVKPEVLKDFYLMMRHDVRFFSTKNGGGIRYKLMESHIQNNYGFQSINERKLRWLISEMNKCRTVNTKS